MSKIEILKNGSGLDHAAEFIRRIAPQLNDEDRATAEITAEVCELHAELARKTGHSIEMAYGWLGHNFRNEEPAHVVEADVVEEVE